MRTTVTLDEDVAAQLRRQTREQGISFKEAINAAIRAGFGQRKGTTRRYRMPTYRMGARPGVDIDRALHLDAALDDQEILRKITLRK
jgi:hypothetical protein